MTDFPGLTNLLLAQLTDPFRIGLMAALLYTTVRNAAVTGTVLPLAAGIVFVAYVIALTFPTAPLGMWPVLGVGLVSNAVIAGVLLVIWQAVKTFRK